MEEKKTTRKKKVTEAVTPQENPSPKPSPTPSETAAREVVQFRPKRYL